MEGNSLSTKIVCETLETPRLSLRKLSLADADDLFQVFSDKKTTKYVPRERHVDKMVAINHLESLIKRMDEGISFVWSVVNKIHNRVIGTVNLYFKQDRAASIGAVINSEQWWKEIATKALKEIINFGFDKMKLIRIDKYSATNIIHITFRGEFND